MAARAGGRRAVPVVTLIPGDGIGPEVTQAAVRVLEAAGARLRWDVQLAGRAAFERHGTPIPEALLASIRRHRVALKGPLETAIGRVGYRSVNVALRKTFDLYANVRPIRSLPGVRAAFSGIDLVVVRENTEDLYSGIEHQIAPGVVEKSIVNSVANKNRSAVISCYEQGRKLNDRLRGEVTVTMLVEPTGAIGRPQIKSTLGNPTVAACILVSVRKWRFPPRSAPAMASYKFVLE